LTSFGEELRRQRELRQVSLEEIADSTKVNLRFLEALERNDFDALPGGLFTRGFIRAYATYVGLDPEATVSAYLFQVEEDHERAERRAQRNPDQPRLEPSEAPPAPRPWLLPAAGGLGAVVIVTALLLWWLLPAGEEEPAGDAAAGPETAAEAVREATPQAPAGESGREPAESPPAPRESVLELAVQRSAPIRVSCGEVDLLERAVEAGEQLTFRCGSEFHLHAPRRDVLEVRLDGVVIPTPGRARSPLRDWVPSRGDEEP
jgi:cytoskeletal protein RodZ